MAGVVGIDLALLWPVSIDSGCVLVTLLPMGLVPHSYGLLWLPIPITLDALVGGVGNVWARSNPGRPVLG